MCTTSLSLHPQLEDRSLWETFAKACGAPLSSTALPSSLPARGGAAVHRDGVMGTRMGDMWQWQSKNLESCMGTLVLLSFLGEVYKGIVFHCAESEVCNWLPKVTGYKQV